MNKAEIILKLKKVLSRYPRVLYAYIAGSMNSPLATEQSDIDLFIVWPTVPEVKERSYFLEELAVAFDYNMQWVFLDSQGEIIRDGLKLDAFPKVEVYHYSIEGFEFTLENMTQVEGLDYSLSLRQCLLKNEALDRFIESFLQQDRKSPTDLYFEIMKDRQKKTIGKRTLDNIYRFFALLIFERVPAPKHWPKIRGQIPMNHLLSEEHIIQWIDQSLVHLTSFSGVAPSIQIGESDIQLQKYNSDLTEKVFEVVKCQSKRLEEFLTWPQKIRTLEDQINFGQQTTQQWNQGKAFHFQLIHNSAFVGAISVHSMDYLDRSFELGYWIDQSSEGKGLIVRALILLLQDLKGRGWEKAKIRVSPKNFRSCRVAERLGMTLYLRSEAHLYYSKDL